MAERTISELLSSMRKRIDLLERRGIRKNGGSGSLRIIELTDTDNLNDIRETGVYQSYASANSAASRNYPILRPGFLEVFHEGNRTLQRFTAETSRNPITFYRYFWNTGWGEWRVPGNEVTLEGTSARNAIHFPYQGLYVTYLNGYGDDYSNGRWRRCTTPWLNLTISSGYGVHSGYTPQMRLLEGVLYARGAISKNSGSFGVGYEIIATVPTTINNAFSDPGWATVSTLHGAGGHLSFRGYWDSGRDLRVYYSRATGSQDAGYTTINGFSGKIIDD